MEKGKECTFFLGANTADGFYSLYDQFIHTEDGDFLWVIKGGPGCGKSSFMRHIGKAAQRNGLSVEYINCSGDPDSLDAVRIPALRVAYVDGTAPHVIEPPFPGAGGAYIDLSRYYDFGRMQERLPSLRALNSAYKAEYRRAYDALAAAEVFSPYAAIKLCTAAEIEAVKRRAQSAIRREMKPKHQSARSEKRFISAFCCMGQVFCSQTVDTLCEKLYILDHKYGLADIYLQEIAAGAEKRGYTAICCPDPLQPLKLEAVLLPELALGFLASESEYTLIRAKTRHIRLDAIPDEKRLRQLRPQLRAYSKHRNQLLEQAQAHLAQAKALHDQLEKLCNDCVDFEAVYREADEHIAALFG